MSIEQWSELMFPEQRGADAHAYGRVVSINADGSYEVQLNRSAVTTKCAPCCSALVGDRVLVVIKANGKCDAIGRLGGEIGGGGEVVMTVNDASNYVAGKVFAHAGTNDPAGALLCDGRAVSRSTYWELFAAIGTTYGAGDGSSTFNLPNIESRTIIGESDSYALGSTGGEAAHTLTVDEMPSHNHDINAVNCGSPYGLASGTGLYTNQALVDFGTSSSDRVKSAGGSQPHNNMQPYIVMRYFITTGKGDPASGINPADYVVKWKDDDNGWFWRKWASGVAELWCYKDFTIDFGGADSAFAPIVQFPFGLQSIEFKDCSIVYVGGNEAMRIEAGGRTNVSLTDTGAYTIVTRNPTNEQSGTLFFQVKGTWKTPSASGGTESIAPTIESRFQGIEADIDLLKTNKVLWSGGWYMNADHTAVLSEPVSAQPNGIVLVWSYYDGSNAANSNWRIHPIPKYLVAAHGGSGFSVGSFGYDYHDAKWVYVSDTSITGHTCNLETNNTGGATFINSRSVLRYVIGV